jgi:hypothetical protein
MAFNILTEVPCPAAEFDFTQTHAVGWIGWVQVPAESKRLDRPVSSVHPRIEARRASRAVALPVSSFAESPHDLPRRSESRGVAGLGFGSSLSRAS